jgi:hypothetical protein
VVNGTPAPESGLPPFVNVAFITKDGRLVNVDPFSGTSVGEWAKASHDRYAVTFMTFTTQNGDVLRIRVRATLEIDGTGDEFSGPFHTEVFDSGENLVLEFDGTVHGTRFEVEPL